MTVLEGLQTFEGGEIPPFDFHLHTSWTDGAHGVAQMHERAVACGLTHVLFSEHARKTSGDWFPEFADEVRSLPADRCRALVGVETKIADFDGTLDCSSEIVSCCDLVIASVHRFPGEDDGAVRSSGRLTPAEAVEIEFRLSLAALENPRVDILGHPFGMSRNRFGSSPDPGLLRQLIQTAAQRGVAIEINPRYCPDPKALLESCLELGTLVSLGSDAHSLGEVGRIVSILRGGRHP